MKLKISNIKIDLRQPRELREAAAKKLGLGPDELSIEAVLLRIFAIFTDLNFLARFLAGGDLIGRAHHASLLLDVPAITPLADMVVP